MDINTAYEICLEKVNNNNSDENIAMDKVRFLDLLNEAELRYLDYKIDQRGSDAITSINHLLVPADFKKVSATEEYVGFELPEDFFRLARVRVQADNGKCKAIMHTKHVEMEDVSEHYTGAHTKPSFGYREVFYNLSQKQLKVYRDNFDIPSVTGTYYRVPKPSLMAGIYDMEGNLTTVDRGLDYEEIDAYRILNAVAAHYKLQDGKTQEGLYDLKFSQAKL